MWRRLSRVNYVIVKSWFLEYLHFKPDWVSQITLQDMSLYQYIYKRKVYQLLKETIKLSAASSPWARLFPGLQKLLMQVTSYVVLLLNLNVQLWGLSS